MQPLDMKVFSKRVTHFFLLNPFAKKCFDKIKFAEFLYNKIEKQNTADKTSTARLTRTFVILALSEFLNAKIPTIVALFRQQRQKRSTAVYEYNDDLILKKKRFSVLASVRTTPTIYKVTNKQNKVVNNDAVKHIQTIMPNVMLAMSPIKGKKSTSARQRATNPSGDVYEQIMASKHPNSNDDLKLWRKSTPVKGSPHRVHFSPKLAEQEEEFRQDLSSIFDYEAHKGTTEDFSFEVTRPGLLKALKSRRVCSQNSIMGNRSAYDFFKAAGAVLHADETGRDVHHCHIQAHSLGGQQQRKNIVCMTKGANLFTNAGPEKATADLLLEKSARKFKHTSKVTYDPKIGLANKAEYFITADDREDAVEVVIDPLSRKIPTRDDFKAAYAFIKTETLSSSPTCK